MLNVALCMGKGKGWVMVNVALCMGKGKGCDGRGWWI